MTTTLPRLLLVEDDLRLGPLIREVLQNDYEVTLVTELDAAEQAALQAAWDVIVTDRRLPGGDALDLVARLRRTGVSAPTLMLTALGTIADRVAGLDAGADDYLVKPFDFDELLARLRALRRVFSSEGEFLRLGSWEFYPISRAIYSPYEGRVMLTDREASLLELLARAPDRTYSRDAILRAVFTAQDRPGTVDTYVHYLRRKTDPDIVTTVRGRGYRLGEV